jgi:CheY-like chemotaxis protein
MKTGGVVLVVDAEHVLQRRVRDIVEPHGFDVAWTTTVEEAFARVHVLRQLRLILVALDFAHTLGWRFVEALHRDPDSTPLSMAVVTAHAEILAAHRLAGVAYPLLSTPIVDDELLRLLGDPPAQNWPISIDRSSRLLQPERMALRLGLLE